MKYMDYSGRMSAYTSDPIPNLPDEVVPVVRQREEQIIGIYA